MGLMKRLRRITAARIEAFLQMVEDPALVFPQLMAEMEDNAQAAYRAEAKAQTAVTAAQRRIDEITGRIGRLERGAEMALEQKDEKTAREAVAAQMAAEKDLDRCREELERAEYALDEAKQTSRRLASDLEHLMVRKDEVLSRARSAKATKKARKIKDAAASGKGILDAVSRMETHVLESELGEDAGNASLERRLERLEREAEVEKRLAQLKKKKST